MTTSAWRYTILQNVDGLPNCDPFTRTCHETLVYANDRWRTSGVPTMLLSFAGVCWDKCVARALFTKLLPYSVRQPTDHSNTERCEWTKSLDKNHRPKIMCETSNTMERESAVHSRTQQSQHQSDTQLVRRNLPSIDGQVQRVCDRDPGMSCNTFRCDTYGSRMDK